MFSETYPWTSSKREDTVSEREKKEEKEEGDEEDVWASLETVGDHTTTGNQPRLWSVRSRGHLF